MPAGGARPNSGPKRGSKQKRTLELEALAARARAEAELLSAAEAGDKARQLIAARAAGKKLGKEILSEFANAMAGAAAYYQPTPDNSNKHANEQKFRYYAELAIYAADKVAPFETPKLSAVAIAANQVTKVEIRGGMPDEFMGPATIEHQPKLAPLTVVRADDPDETDPVEAPAVA